MARSIAKEDAAAFVCEMLQKKPKLRREDLSARNVSKALGQTTGFLYHHWGSFDAFLFDVSGIGWSRLVEAVARAFEKTEAASSIVRSYVAFAAENPVLYWLMAERELPADVVRSTLERGAALPSYTAWMRFFELVSKAQPGMTIGRARAMHAAAHGLASQLLSGRIASMPDALQRDARAIAGDVEDAIADAMLTSRSSAPRSPARDPRAGSPSRPRTTSPRAKSSRRSSR